MIPDEVVEQVREAADIVQIIGEYVKLKKTGADHRGPCPFHQGTHKNFSVSSRKGIYYCFVCHEGGDVFRFIQKRLGVEWPEAVRIVGGKAGVEVREVDTRREGPDTREPFWEVNAAAADYFKRALWEDDRGRHAREYLEKRSIPRELAEEIGIGFAPHEIGLMRTHLTTLGFDDVRMLEIGLLVQREEATEPRPRFRDRLMFPILDVMGRHVGFGGRVLGNSEPKYLNSPDSPVFSKGKLLYGLSWAKNEIRREDRILIVEGYFDVVRLMAAGLHTAVAPLGTALTEEQAALARKYTKNAILLYDNDKAGLVASFRSGDELLAKGMSVRVVTLPEGDDPDTFVKREGPTGLEKQIEASIDVFERKIQILQRVGAFTELHKKRRALDRLLPTIRATADPIMRDLYLLRTGEVSGIDRTVLLREMEGGGRRQGRAYVQQQPRSEQPDNAPPPVEREGGRVRGRAMGPSDERELIRIMLNERSRVAEIAEKVGPESFRNAAYRRIFRRLMQLPEHSDISEIVKGLAQSEIDIIEEMLAAPSPRANEHKVIEDSLTSIRAHELDKKIMDLASMIPLASLDEKNDLIQQKMDLVKERNTMKGGRYKAFAVSDKPASRSE